MGFQVESSYFRDGIAYRNYSGLPMKYARQLAQALLLSTICFDLVAAEQPVAAVENLANSATLDTTNKTTAAAEPIVDQRWGIHGQMTSFTQTYAAFNAPYSGTNSLPGYSDSAATFDADLFIGIKLWTGAEAYFNPEINQGFGLAGTLGIAGFPSGAAYKVGSAEPYYRTTRAFIRQSFNLGGDSITLEDQPNQLAKKMTSNNIVITAGKFAVVDIFDTNTYAHDPRLDFANWVGVEAGAFDYAADAWGYTYGAAIEWNQDWWSLRGGFFDLSVVPNSTQIDIGFKQYQLVTEFEERHELWDKKGKFKVLGFVNRANMGRYSDAVALAQQTGGSPDTGLVRQMAWRPGVAINFEQEITPTLGVFLRASQNSGAQEAYEFTDINQSVSGGLSIKGNSWGRPNDTLGLAGIVNGISKDAQQYFANGGLGILVGDGALNYGPEQILEAYYSFAATDFLTFSIDYQHITNPGYNRDRGPVNIFGFRARAYF